MQVGSIVSCTLYVRRPHSKISLKNGQNDTVGRLDTGNEQGHAMIQMSSASLTRRRR